MKTSELIGPALDWAVAKCEWAGRPARPYFINGTIQITNWIPGKIFSPSTDWSQGGPIIEREINTLIRCKDGCNKPVYFEARAGFDEESVTQYGPTPLIATMRCYVASLLGNEVEVPEQLL